MTILWTSPHCRPDWIERLGEESQGGQTEVMYKQPKALIKQNPDYQIDIYTRYQDDDFQVDKDNSDFIGKELLHYPKHCIHVKELEEVGIRIIRLPAGPSDRYIPKEQLYGKFINQFVESMFAFSKGNGVVYDIAHGHYADGWEAVTKLSKMLKEEENIDLPTILTTHSLGRRKKEDCLQRGEGSGKELDAKYNFPARIASEEVSLKHASRICPLSTTEKEFLEENYKAVEPDDFRITVTPNGINPADFSHAEQEEVSNLEQISGIKNAFAILVPSRVDPRKGQLTLLKALNVLGKSFLKENGIRALLVAWPENNTDYTQRIDSFTRENNLEGFIIKQPPVAHEKMPVYFDSADLVVIPSQEYFSIAMIEAMLLEKLLIASKEGGSRDAVVNGKSGILVNHTDPEEIAEAVSQVVSMSVEERAEMGKKAKQRILENYTLDSVAEKITEIYNTVVK